MLLEEFIAAKFAGHGSGQSQPIAIFVDDGETVDAIDRGSTGIGKVSKFRNGRRTGAVHLEAGDDAKDAGVQKVKAVLGVLGERTRKVRHLGSCILPRVSRALHSPQPLIPGMARRTSATKIAARDGKRLQAGFMTDGIQRAGILRNEEKSHGHLILP
jgi:hypothetical protein